MNDPQMTVDEILDALEPIGGGYPRAALDAAMAQPEAMIPRLIEILHNATQEPDSFLESPLPFYALILLGHLRAGEAHAAILDFAALDCDALENMLGDVLTELMPIILYRTCGGQVEGIKALALDPEACEDSRSAPLDALAYAVVDGVLPRGEMMDFLGSLLDPARAAELPEMTQTFAASTAYSLQPAELMDVLKAAFEADLIDQLYIGDWEGAKVANEMSRDEAYQLLRARMASDSLDDLHAMLPSWNMYNHGADDSADDNFLLPPSQDELLSMRSPKTYDDAKRKKKRKAAKASRKKNRRK